MNTKRDAERLIKNLAQQLGDLDLSFKMYNRCSTKVDDIPLSFTYSPEHYALFIEAELGSVDDYSTSGKALEKLLDANNYEEKTAGGVIGFNKDDGKVYLAHGINLPIADMPGSEKTLSALVTRLVPAASWGRSLLKKRSPAASPYVADNKNISRI